MNLKRIGLILLVVLMLVLTACERSDWSWANTHFRCDSVTIDHAHRYIHACSG
jgi:hypothetical protein